MEVKCVNGLKYKRCFLGDKYQKKGNTKDNMELNKKIIVFKIPEFPHISETFVIAQILTAIKLSFDVKIITRKFKTDNIHLIEHLNLIDKVIVENYKIPKNKVIRVLKWGLLLFKHSFYINYIVAYYRAQTKFSLTWLFHWVFYKQFSDAAIFHVQYGTNSKPFPILKLSKFIKQPVVVTFHGHDAFFPLYGYIENDGYYNNLFACDAIITANTPYLSNKIETLGCPKEKLDVVPVGVNTSFFYPNKEASKNKNILKLITVGRLDKVKGHQYCIDVVKRLLELDVKVELTIIGEGEERHHLEMLINKYDLNNNVELLGSKGASEIRESLWQHDVYMLLAVPVENDRRETQGLATLEAQACGLPAVVFDSGGVKYTVKNGVSGYVCKEFDINSVVEKVKYLSENRIALADMGKNAVKFVNDAYSQKHIDEKWKQLYNEITQE